MSCSSKFKLGEEVVGTSFHGQKQRLNNFNIPFGSRVEEDSYGDLSNQSVRSGSLGQRYIASELN